ncbi:MAG: serine hydrolase domain-containing protein [Vicinamibacterales bacterium]
MAREVRRRLGFALVVVALAGCPQASGWQADPGAIAKAEAAVSAAFTASGAPGAIVTVVSGDTVVWTRAYGVANIETGAAITADTLFQIGSVTKTFTAAAVLAASAQGVVALDRPVRTYIPGLTPCVGAPTLSQLLSHTGGIIDEPDEYGPQGEDGLGAYQRTWTSEYCMLPPGRAFSYSNSGFALAGLALQEAEKKPFADVMRARVLDPLGMTRTTFRPTEAMTWPLAVGHRRDKDGKFTVVRPLANDARLWPAGTLYSSATEMARFATALLHDGKVSGAPGLPAGIVERMRARIAEIPTTGQAYGLGLFHDSFRRYGHGGTMTGYVARMDVDPSSRLAVIVMTNGDNANAAELARRGRILGLALRDVAETTIDEPPAYKPQLLGGDAARYVGTFRNPRRFTVEVLRAGDGLVLKRFGRDFSMRYYAPGHFLVDLPRGRVESIRFGLPDSGPADYLQMNLWALARVAR